MPEASLDSIDHFAAVLERLPAGVDLEALARGTKAFRRPRGVRSGTDLFRLTLAWACGGRSMRNIAAWAGERGIATLTDEALVQRLHRTAPFLEALSNQLLAHVGQVPSWRGRVLRIADGTSLSKPASKGTDWRIHAVFDLGLGGFSHLGITDGRGAEALDRGEPVAGEIRVGDRGYANAQAWQRFLQARDERTDFVVRMRWSTVRLLDETGELFDIIGWLKTRPADSETHEIAVWAQSGKHQPPIPIRLIARRKTPEAIATAHKLLRQRASRKQTRIDPRSYVAAEYVVLATSLPAEEYPAEQVLAVYRLRWQIELAFKRLKSLIKVDEIRTRTEAGTRCWLYAHLIVALLTQDFCQDFLESFPSGAGRRGGHQFIVARDRDRIGRHSAGDHAGDDVDHVATALSGAA
jgi:hypothetical protein